MILITYSKPHDLKFVLYTQLAIISNIPHIYIYEYALNRSICSYMPCLQLNSNDLQM